MLAVIAAAIFVLVGRSEDLLEFVRREVVGRDDIGRLRLFLRVHRIFFGSDRWLRRRRRSHIAVVPGRPELGKVDRKDLVDMDELARLAEG